MKRTVLPALTFTGSPVRGFIALRAFVFFTVNVPKLGSVNPPSFFSSLTIASISVPAATLAATPVQFVLYWITPAMKALLITVSLLPMPDHGMAL